MHALALLTGSVLDLLVGDPQRRHPVAAFGAAAAYVEDRVWRDTRAAGVAHTTLLVGAPTALAWSIERRAPLAGRSALLALATWVALGGRSLWREARRITAAVEGGDLAAARDRLPALVGRDPSDMDERELARAVVESVAENTSDAVVAPLVYAALFGVPGVVAHRCANTLDAMVGHRCARYARFGWGAARLDDVLAWLPARVTVLLACALAPLVGGRPARALRTARRDGRAHPSPNAGPVEAAFAGALGVRLGGVNRYGDTVEVRGPLGDGPAPRPRDVHRAVVLSAAVSGASVLLAVTVAAARREARA